jgi:hypothetical protein
MRRVDAAGALASALEARVRTHFESWYKLDHAWAIAHRHNDVQPLPTTRYRPPLRVQKVGTSWHPFGCFAPPTPQLVGANWGVARSSAPCTRLTAAAPAPPGHRPRHSVRGIQSAAFSPPRSPTFIYPRRPIEPRIWYILAPAYLLTRTRRRVRALAIGLLAHANSWIWYILAPLWLLSSHEQPPHRGPSPNLAHSGTCPLVWQSPPPTKRTSSGLPSRAQSPPAPLVGACAVRPLNLDSCATATLWY